VFCEYFLVWVPVIEYLGTFIPPCLQGKFFFLEVDMKRTFLSVVSILIGLSMILMSFAPVLAGSNGEKKITICHAAGQAGTTHFETHTISWHAVFGPAGHFYENGTTRSGHEDDYFGACISTPTATNTVVYTLTAPATATVTEFPTETTEPTSTNTIEPTSTNTDVPPTVTETILPTETVVVTSTFTPLPTDTTEPTMTLPPGTVVVTLTPTAIATATSEPTKMPTVTAVLTATATVRATATEVIPTEVVPTKNPTNTAPVW